MMNRGMAIALAASTVLIATPKSGFAHGIPFDARDVEVYGRGFFDVGRARPNRSSKQAKPRKRSNRKTVSYRTKARHKRAA